MTTIVPGELIPASTINQWAPVGAVIDFAGATAPDGWFICDGSAISRTTYADLLAVVTLSRSGVRTNGSAVVTGLSSTTDLRVGMGVEGTGIPTSTTILSVDSGSQITLSANATSTTTNNLTIFYYGAGNGSTTYNLPDCRGRQTVGIGTHTDVAALGNNDGSVLASRRPKHKHTVPTGSDVPTTSASSVQIFSGGTGGANGAYVTNTVGPQTGSEPTDAPAYLALNKIIRAKDV